MSGYGATLLDLSNAVGPREKVRLRLDLLRRSQGIVIVDFPPLSSLFDAHAVFTDIEGVILVVDAGRLDGTAVLESLQEAGLTPCNLLGVVLNNVRERVPA